MKTVFFDIDTQIDFLYPAGALYVPGAERILAGRRRAESPRSAGDFHYVRARRRRSRIQDLSAPLRRRDSWASRSRPRRCVEKRAMLPARVEGAQQVILEKQELDCFSNPHLAPLLAGIECGPLRGLRRGHRDLRAIRRVRIAQDRQARGNGDGCGEGAG